RAAERHVDDRGLPGHLGRECVEQIQGHRFVIANAAFVRTAGLIVLYPIGLEPHEAARLDAVKALAQAQHAALGVYRALAQRAREETLLPCRPPPSGRHGPVSTLYPGCRPRIPRSSSGSPAEEAKEGPLSVSRSTSVDFVEQHSRMARDVGQVPEGMRIRAGHS